MARRNYPPRLKASGDAIDIIAVIISLLCLVLGIITIAPFLPYAARLSYTSQIVVIGLLLAIMNQAMLRVLMYFSLVLERWMGPSSLQNYSALLTWSAFESGMGWFWRTFLILFTILPLALSALYKQYTGGIGIQIMPEMDSYFAPTVLPGLEKVPGLSMMANATIPFLTASASNDEPPDFTTGQATPYGYNIILISDKSAAALDIPMQDTFTRLQNELEGDEKYYLNTSLRGTVVTFNDTVDTHRDDPAFWNKYTSLASLQSLNNYDGAADGSYFGMLAQTGGYGEATNQWDTSWVFLGNWRSSEVNASDPNGTLKAFQQNALALEVHRHNCSAVFQITRSSVKLEAGSCSPTPLPWQYQYYEAARPAMTSFFFTMIQQHLGRTFADGPIGAISDSWRNPSYAVTMASAFHIRVAMANNTAPIRPNGNISTYWESFGKIASDGSLNETYFIPNVTLSKSSSTLRADPSLYAILAIQPLLTVIAFLAPFILLYWNSSTRAMRKNSLIMPRGFSFVAILAGLDLDSLAVLRADKNSAFAGDVSLTGDTKSQVTLDLEMRTDQNGLKGKDHRIGSHLCYMLTTGSSRSYDPI